jgi:N-acetylglucosamine repressor
MNLQTALNLLRDGEARSSPEVGEALSVQPPTVARLMGCLERAGLVRDAGLSSSQAVGRPAKMWAINASAGHVVGLSAGPCQVSGVLMDLAGEMVREAAEPCADGFTTSWMRRAVPEVCSALTASVPSDTVMGVALALGGVVDSEAGIVRACGSLAGDGALHVKDYAIRAELADRVGWPTPRGWRSP